MASRPGTFRGANTQYNGDGFAHQRFDVMALPAGAYDRWLTQARAANRPLDAATWRRLSARSVIPQPVVFSSVTPQLFDQARDGDQTYAIRRFTDEVNRLYGVLNNRLYKHKYLAGDQYTIADMICYPWTINWKFQGQDIEEFKHFKRWQDELAARPAVQKGYHVPAKVQEIPIPA